MREFATQMEAARGGIVTEELKKVAKKERMTVEELMPLVAEGKVVICANKNHSCIEPEGVGSMLRTKINVNLGVSRDCKDYDVGESNGSCKHGRTCNYGFVFPWRYHSFPQKTYFGMPGNDWHSSGIRCRHSLSEGSGDPDGEGFFGCGTSSCARRR